MPNDSSTGGYLQPADQPEYDIPLEDIFQPAIVGITGLPGSLVRADFQVETSNLPSFDTDWCAFRVTVVSHDSDAHVKHDPILQSDGASTVSRDEELELKTMFYGPRGGMYLSRWVNGLSVDQNRWPLMQHGVKFRGVGRPANIPALLQNQWVRRVDLTTQFARRTHIIYPVRTVVGIDIDIDNERYITPVRIRQP